MSDRDRRPKFRRAGGKAADKGRDSGRRPAWRERGASPDGPVILYGWHTVAAALANPQRRIRKLWLSENAARRLADDNIDTRVTPESCGPVSRSTPQAGCRASGLLAEAIPASRISMRCRAASLVLDQILIHNINHLTRQRRSRSGPLSRPRV